MELNSRCQPYEDFQNSKCEILLLIDDNSYIFVYVKNPLMLKTIRETAVRNCYENIAYITDEGNPDNLEWL